MIWTNSFAGDTRFKMENEGATGGCSATNGFFLLGCVFLGFASECVKWQDLWDSSWKRFLAVVRRFWVAGRKSVCETVSCWSVAVLCSSSVWSLGGVHRSPVCGGWWRWWITTNSSCANIPRGLIGIRLLAAKFWRVTMLLSEDKCCNFHQKCVILGIVAGSLKLSALHGLDSGSLEEKDDILSRWESLSTWSLLGVCLHNK